MNYLRYHRASGIIYNRMVADPHFAVESDPEFALFEGEGSQDEHWIKEGQLAPRTLCEGIVVTSLVQVGPDPISLLSSLPDPCWVRIRGVSGQYENLSVVQGGKLDFIPSSAGTYVATLEGEHTAPEMPFEVVELETLKARRHVEVTARKASALLVGVEWNGHRWDADDAAKANINSVCAAVAAGMELPDDFYWTDYDNQDVPLSAADVTALGNAIVAFTIAVHNNSRSLKQHIQNCSTLSELEAIALDSGWPTGQ